MIFILGVATFVVPPLLFRKWKWVAPKSITVSYYTFLIASIIFGELFGFYYRIPLWDAFLHLFSGSLLAVVGFSVLHLLGSEQKPLTTSLFVLFFALAAGTVWEIYEFIVDGIMGMNMQKFALEDGTALFGRAAVVDTMTDLIMDALGAVVVAGVGYFSLKKEKDWVEKVLIKRDTEFS